MPQSAFAAQPDIKYIDRTWDGGKKNSYTVRKLMKGKTYYIAIRPYKNQGGHRYVGVSCTPKKVKVK